MLIKKFTAKIEGLGREATVDEFDRNFNWAIFEFTRSKILFTKRQTNKEYFQIFESCKIIDKTKYTFAKAYDDNDKKRFQIAYGEDDCKAFLKINWWNKIKCNIIHGRYFLHREREWFIKTIIAALIGFAFGLIGTYLGYRQGYQNGLKASQQQTRPTNR